MTHADLAGCTRRPHEPVAAPFRALIASSPGVGVTIARVETAGPLRTNKAVSRTDMSFKNFGLRDFAISAFSGCLGGLLVLMVDNQFEVAREVQRAKLEVIRKVAGGRAAIVASAPFPQAMPTFLEGLNETMVVFSDSKEVVTALVRFKEVASSSDKSAGEDRLTDLFKAMLRDVGIDPASFNDSLFLTPFTTTTK